ncbi:zinc finger protein 91 [Cryptotermes secundus]|uniref:zinc finger protein 91 n=1 Tax=Cryptotermes secundus TaxID=105785 RepID=UPI000CD7B781|nr:zinc finger protein 91 [Cryptotermes secundus]
MYVSQDAVRVVEVTYVSNSTKELLPVQNSVKNQLLLQALPPYVPPNSPSHQYSSEQFFSCKDCGDKFLLESSLLRHIERRSVRISYGCRTCARTVLFYNRCALLAHLRGHFVEQRDDAASESINISEERITYGSFALRSNEDSEKNDDMELESDAVSLSPLPKNKILLGPFIPMAVDDCGRLIHEGSSQKQKSQASALIVNNQVASHENESKEVSSSDNNNLPENKNNVHQNQVVDKNTHQQLPVSGGKNVSLNTKDNNQQSDDVLLRQVPDVSTTDNSTPDGELPGSMECKECGTVPQTGDMKDHFLCSNLPVDLQFKCKTCNLILPSPCSFSAHQRIHRQMKPYICPECSHEFDLWSALSVHLLYTCFHMFKSVRHRCIRCKCLFPTAVSLEVHLLTQHVKAVYKCNACPIACFSMKALHDHKVSTHENPTFVTYTYQQCQLCPNRVIPKSRLLTHINEHSKEKSVRMYVYQCSDCSFFVQKKSDFASHRAVCSRSGKVKFAAVPSALSPNKVLASHKIKIHPDKEANNPLKVVYTVPQNQMQLVVLPKSAVESVKRAVLPQPKLKKLIRKLDATPQKIKNTGAPAKNATPMEGEEVQKDLNDKEENKYVYLSESKCESMAEETEAVLSEVSDCTVVKIPVILDNMDSTSPDNSSFTPRKSIHFLNLCSNCREQLILFSNGIGAAKVPEFCAECAKKNSFLKINRTLESTSKIKASDETVSANNSVFKRSANSIALNGPTNIKKLKTSSNVSLENKYRCHICKMLISMDWLKIQEHFASNHPNFKLLVLSPKINKLKLKHTNLRVPFLSKDQRMYPKIRYVKKGATASNSSNVTKVNGNAVHDDDDDDDNDNKDHQFHENCVEKESNNSGNEKRDNSHENLGYYENAYYLKKERDIPIDYDLVPSKIKRKKKSSQKASDRADKEVGANTPFSSGQVVPVLQQVPSSGHKYECSKCHYADSCAESFHEHIKLHHSDESAFQCMECGMCFVAKPSLEKHLFISHRIKNAEAYLQNNNCCVSPAKGEEMEDTSIHKESSPPLEDFSPDLVENQCRVCRKIFDTSFQLSKHFRTHGMAFLLMKKHGNKGP